MPAWFWWLHGIGIGMFLMNALSMIGGRRA